jgi:hypothetical protein
LSGGGRFVAARLPGGPSAAPIQYASAHCNELTPFETELFLGPGDLYAADSTAECDVTLTVTVRRQGVPDPAFHEESTFVLQRSRSTTFYSVP